MKKLTVLLMGIILVIISSYRVYCQYWDEEPGVIFSYPYNTKVGIGTYPINLLDIGGGIAIGSSYSGSYTAPTNGVIIQGNVGLGTTSPSYKLHVAGDIYTSSNLYIGSAARFYSTSSYLMYVGPRSFYITNSVPNTYIYSDNTYLGGTSGDVIHVRGNIMKGNSWYMEGDGLRLGSQASPGSWELYVTGQTYVSDYLRADGGIHVGGSSDPGTDNLIVDGKVGIGTTSPSYKLHVAGDIYAANGWLRTSGAKGLYSQSYGLYFYPVSSNYWRIRSDAGLEFYNKLGTVKFGSVEHDNANSFGLKDKSNEWILRSDYDNGLTFYTTDEFERMRISDNGNVGINTTNPQYKLHVNGSVNIDGTIYQNGQAFGGGQWYENANGIHYNGGKVGIGKSTPAYTLDVNGTIKANTLIVNDIHSTMNIENVTADNYEEFGYPEYAIDGNYSTFWYNDYFSTTYITADLGSETYIGTITLTLHSSYGIKYYLKGSSDNSNWIELDQKDEYTTGTVTHNVLANYRYIKVEVYESSMVHIYEIEISTDQDASVWLSNANGIHYNGGKVGIGTIDPSSILSIESDGSEISGGGNLLNIYMENTRSWDYKGAYIRMITTGEDHDVCGLQVGVKSTNTGYFGYVTGASFIAEDATNNYSTGVFASGNTGVVAQGTGDGYGVYAYNSNDGTGIYGKSNTGKAIHGYSSNGYAGYFEGKSYFSDKVGIGTTTFPTEDTECKLAVHGNIWCEKVKVKLYENWTDYVFEEDYKLRTLAEVERYIKTNNHLPGVPSAQEVYEDGIDLGNMDAILLGKIEELTLYIIEQDKKIEAQQKLIEKLLEEK